MMHRMTPWGRNGVFAALVSLFVSATLLGGCAGDELPHAECAAGDTREQPCGINRTGLQRERCSDDYRWVPDGACDDPTECVNGDVRVVACGLNDRGVQQQLCRTGQWRASAVCDDVDACVDDDTDTVGCAVDATRGQNRRCVTGQWENDGACFVIAVCEDDDVDVRACGRQNEGLQTRLCVDGQWGQWTECSIEDACVDGAVREVECGADGAGVGEATCADGLWQASTFCRLVADGVSVAGGSGVVAWKEGEGLWVGGDFGAAAFHRFADEFGVAASDVMLKSTLVPGGNVAIGEGKACYVTLEGRVACWGTNANGVIDWTAPTTDVFDEPRVIPDVGTSVARVVKVVMNDYSACALLSDGSVKCWGTSSNVSSVGRGETSTGVYEPDFITGYDPLLDPAVDIVGGMPGSEQQTLLCTLHASDAVRCWGNNRVTPITRGVRFLPGTTSEDATIYTPMLIPAFSRSESKLVSFALDAYGGCFLYEDTELRCMHPFVSPSNGNTGVVGNGTDDAYPVPVPIMSPLATFTANFVALTDGKRVVVRSDGTVYVWGLNGTVGWRLDASNATALLQPRLFPRFDYSTKNVVAIFTGRDGVCAQMDDKTVQCWRGSWGSAAPDDTANWLLIEP